MEGACVSLVPKLEPLLGIGLAMNLAYLNLPIFSFLTVISRSVKECIDEVTQGAKNQVEATPWFKDAKALSEIHTLSTLDLRKPNPRWIRFKSGINAALFNIIFHYRIGRLVSCLATAFCATLIIVGSAVEVGADEWLCRGASWIGTPFWLSVGAFLWPVFCVSAGAWIRYSTVRELNYSLTNLGAQAVQEADTALGETERALEEVQ